MRRGRALLSDADRPEHGADGRLPVLATELAFADCGEHLQHDADHRLHCEIHREVCGRKVLEHAHQVFPQAAARLSVGT